MKDYSQNGEQRQILAYFGDFRGTVLDIGANDGVLLSNSRALVELGWSAVLVEPAEIAFRKLCNANRVHDGAIIPPDTTHYKMSPLDAPGPMIQCVQAAITEKDGPIDFYDSGTHLKKGDTSLLSTTRPEEMARWKKSGEVFTKTTVRGITFATLLEECGLELHSRVTKGPLPNNAATFEFISIDCEGCDLDVLRQIDLTAVGCRLLCIEVNRNDQRPFDEHCAKHGMKLLHRNYENAIYCR